MNMAYGLRCKEMIMADPKSAEVTITLSNDELHILISLVEQLLELLGEVNFIHHYQSDDPFAQLMFAAMGNIQSPVEQPEDPVLRRLLPNAYADAESSAEFRKYTEMSLRTAKQKHLFYLRQQLLSAVEKELVKAVIKVTDPSAWAIAINDLRLALAVRLDIEQSSYEKYELMPSGDPQKPLFAVYFWLGGLQERMISNL